MTLAPAVKVQVSNLPLGKDEAASAMRLLRSDINQAIVFKLLLTITNFTNKGRNCILWGCFRTGSQRVTASPKE